MAMALVRQVWQVAFVTPARGYRVEGGPGSAISEVVNPLATRLVMLGGIAAVIILRRLKKAKAKAKAAAAAAAGASPKPKKPDFIGAVWKAVWPKWFKAGPAGAGSTQMLLLVLLNAARVWVAALIANNVYVGDTLLYTRNGADYRAFVLYQLRLSFSNNLLENCGNLVRDSLSRQWREKLTHTMHSKYFAKSNYYHAEQHMKDSDVRITEDVKELSDGFAKCAPRPRPSHPASLALLCTSIWRIEGFALTPGVGCGGAACSSSRCTRRRRGSTTPGRSGGSSASSTCSRPTSTFSSSRTCSP